MAVKLYSDVYSYFVTSIDLETFLVCTADCTLLAVASTLQTCNVSSIYEYMDQNYHKNYEVMSPRRHTEEVKGLVLLTDCVFSMDFGHLGS